MKRFSNLITLLAFICLFSVSVAGCRHTDSISSEPSETGESSVQNDSHPDSDSENDNTDSIEEETAAKELPDSGDKTEFRVGETFSHDGLNMTYVSSSNWKSDNEFSQPSDGNKFIKLLFHVDNQSQSDYSVSAFSFKCYADGYDCSQHYTDDDLSASLSSGRSADGSVCFEVPSNAKEIEVEYEYNLFSDKKVKFIFEGDSDSGLNFESDTTSNENAYHVGDVIETKKLKISYLKAAEFKSDNMFLKPGDGKKYAYIELEVENLSDSDQRISYFSFNCYADGSSCDGFYGMDDALSATLSAGRKAKGTIAFEVPIDAKTVEFEFEDNIWTDNKIIFSYEE